jgi:uncharacterized protein with NRDE domain
MCLIILSFLTHPQYPLIIAANRDESYSRMASPAAFWSDHPQVHAGRDLEKGGTWLGITRAGRIAAVTNYRAGNANKEAPSSRGKLVSDYLRGDFDAASYLAQTALRGEQYNGFSLLAGNPEALFFLSNQAGGVQRIPPGVHGLSNHLLNTPWPKVERGKRIMEQLTGADESELAGSLFSFLGSHAMADERSLPDTGVGLQRERELSPAFICGERYGTRASTLVLAHRNGEILFTERSFGAGGKPLGEVCSRFVLTRFGPNG